MKQMRLVIVLIFSSVILYFLLKPYKTEMNIKTLTEPRKVLASSYLFQSVSECACKRLYFYQFADNQGFKIYKSTCSDEGTFYQKDQKVISFSMYYSSGKNNTNREILYKEGLLLNLQRIKEFYPGHTMRVYTNVDLKPGGDYCSFVCNNSDVFWCDSRRTPSLGDMTFAFYMTWRFLPLGDDTVEFFLSRDLDSAITEREVAVFHDWFKVGKPLYLMRDKRNNHNIPILGGMWGARNNLLGIDIAKKLRANITYLTTMSKQIKGQNQDILNKVIFYSRANDIVAYDSYHCERWRNFTLVKPFPTQRLNNFSDFVGNIDLGRKKYKWLEPCPVDCRPSYGKTWKFC